jgi:hypothetical protein
LEDRLVPASASFNAAQSLLQVSGQVIGISPGMAIEFASLDAIPQATINTMNAAAGKPHTFDFATFALPGGGFFGDLFVDTSVVKNVTVTDTGNDLINLDSTAVSGRLNVTGGAIALLPGVTVSASTVQLTGQGTAPTPVGLMVPAGAKVQGGWSVTLNGTGRSAATSGDAGVLVSGGTVTAGNGGVGIYGFGRGTGNNEDGIDLWNGATVSATGTGTVFLNGNASPTGRDGNFGVCVTTGSNSATSNTNSVAPAGAHTRVNTVNGSMVVVGNGAGSGQWNYGVAISTGGLVQATGTGDVQLLGNGVHGTNWDEGVLITSSGSAATANGKLTIQGTSHGSGTGNNGIDINNHGSAQSTKGSISMTGNGSGRSNGNSGVAIYNSGTVTALGTLEVHGNGSTSGTAGNVGIFVDGSGTKIQGGSLGDLKLVGVGGGSLWNNYGVEIADSAIVSGSGIGKVIVTGDGSAGTYSNDGVLVANMATLSGTTNELIATGTAHGSRSNNNGVNVNTDATVRTTSGNLSITGNGSGAGNGNSGVAVYSGGKVTGASAGMLQVRGFGSANGADYNEGVYVDGVSSRDHTSSRINADGKLDLAGIARGYGSYNYGVTVSGAAFLGGDSATIFGVNTAILDHDANFGVNITGGGSAVRTNHDLNITGGGGGAGNWDYGIGIQSGAVLSGSSIELTGNGSNYATGTMSDGVFLSKGGVYSYGGDVTIKGTAGSKSTGTDGISIHSSWVEADAGGNVKLKGVNGPNGHSVTVTSDSHVVAPSGTVTQTPDSILKTTNFVTPGIDALGGWANLTLYSNGNYTIQWHAHDSGFESYDFTFAVVLRADVPNGNGGTMPFMIAMQKSGSVAGTFSLTGSRNFDATESGFNQVIADNYEAFANATLTPFVSDRGSLTSVLGDIGTYVLKGIVGTVLAPVMPVVFIGTELGSLIATGNVASGSEFFSQIMWHAGPFGTLYAIAADAFTKVATSQQVIPQDLYDWAQNNVFKGTLPPRDSILLTDAIGPASQSDPKGRPFTFEDQYGHYLVNLGRDGYNHPMTFDMVSNGKSFGQTLIHELTHVWQMAHKPDLKIYIDSVDAKGIEIAHPGQEGLHLEYGYGDFDGRAFTDYNIEQQAHIVEDWYVASLHRISDSLSDHQMSSYTFQDNVNDPFFLYIGGNIRAGIV